MNNFDEDKDIQNMSIEEINTFYSDIIEIPEPLIATVAVAGMCGHVKIYGTISA